MGLRAYQVFAGMDPDQAIGFCRRMAEHSKAVFDQAVAAAGAGLSMRPAYLRKLPLEKRAGVVRRSLARVAANAAAEELLAVYFLECRKELLVEWLDIAGVSHEDGALQEDSPAEPEPQALRKAVETFRSADDDPDRALLLRAFAAQSAIDWPELEAAL